MVVSLAPFSVQCSCHTKVWIMDTGNCCQDEWSCFPSYLFQVWHFWAWGCWRWGTQVDFWSWWCCSGVSGQEGWLLMWGGRIGKPNQAILSFPFSIIIRESNRAVSAAGLWFWCGGEGEEGDGAVPPAHALGRSHPPPDPHSWSLIARISQIAAPSYNSLSYVTLFKHHHFPPSGTYKSLEE